MENRENHSKSFLTLLYFFARRCGTLLACLLHTCDESTQNTFLRRSAWRDPCECECKCKLFSRQEDLAQQSVSSCEVSKTGLRLDRPVSDALLLTLADLDQPSTDQRKGNVRMTYPSAHGISDIIAIDASMLNQSTVVSLFERQVSLQPGSTALEVNEKSFTYIALDSLANALARQLKRLGVGCNDVVAICLKRTENLLVGILGVLKAGAAYLPLNPDDPPLRLGRIIAHAAARFTVTDSASKTNLPDESSELLLLDEQLAERQMRIGTIGRASRSQRTWPT